MLILNHRPEPIKIYTFDKINVLGETTPKLKRRVIILNNLLQLINKGMLNDDNRDYYRTAKERDLQYKKTIEFEKSKHTVCRLHPENKKLIALTKIKGIKNDIKKIPYSNSIKIYVWDEVSMIKSVIQLDVLLTYINSGLKYKYQQHIYFHLNAKHRDNTYKDSLREALLFEEMIRIADGR